MKKIQYVVVSLFDGMSCGRVAFDRTEVDVVRYYSSEIKPHALKVASHHYPQDDEFRLGDVTKIDGIKLRESIKKEFSDAKIILVGGSPCQDFSGANKERLGVQGIKSGLFYEYVRLLNEIKPDYFFLENVRMKKEHQEIIDNEVLTSPHVVNSELVAPHLRHRLYWTNIEINSMPDDLNILLNDCLIEGYSDRKKARTLLESDSRPLSTPIKMAHRYFNIGFTTLIFKDKQHYDDIKLHFDTHFKGKSAKEIDEISQNIDLSIYDGLRYMTNRERERCQTMPDGYTDMLSQNDAACLLGDGWTVDVVAHFFRHLPVYE